MINRSISRGIVERALKDSKFKAAFPEFNSVVTLSKPKPLGCSTCRNVKKVTDQGVQVSLFANIAASLTTKKLTALKKYFNTDTLQYRSDNEVKTL